MSASRRLAKLKRGSMVPDTNRVIPKNVTQTNVNRNEKNRNMVDQLTILTWHEQRINKLEENIIQINEENDRELIESLIDTIEALQTKLNVLSEGYNTLIKKSLEEKEVVEQDVMKEVKKELNTVKLKISSKN